MKHTPTKPYPRFRLFLASLGGLLAGASLPLSAAEVEINYEDPESYSDMGSWGDFDRNLFESFKSEMEEKLNEVADEYLADEAKLTIEFRDVDLAGEVEPWMRPSMSDVRIVKDIYPPRLKFHYKVTSADEETVVEGVAQLTDLGFLWGANPIRRDMETFYYERELIDDWARRVLRNSEQ